MPFQLPENLHPDCAPVAWLLGTWRGNGHGDYPTIDSFQFGQELIFTHDGRPFFHYMSRAWIVDDKGEKVRDAAIETGFLRPKADGAIELLLAHNTGFVEIYYGSAEIVVVSNETTNDEIGSPTVQVIRDEQDRWIQARRIWNQHTYHVTNVREDATVPQFEVPHWTELNTYRTNAQIEGGSVCQPIPEG